MSEYVRKELGYEAEILNGATANGNKTVLQLKLNSLQEEVERKERMNEHLNEEIMKMHRMAERLGIRENDIGLLPLMAKLDDLENQNEVLREIIKRNGCTYSKEIENITAQYKSKCADFTVTPSYLSTTANVHGLPMVSYSDSPVQANHSLPKVRLYQIFLTEKTI